MRASRNIVTGLVILVVIYTILVHLGFWWCPHEGHPLWPHPAKCMQFEHAVWGLIFLTIGGVAIAGIFIAASELGDWIWSLLTGEGKKGEKG